MNRFELLHGDCLEKIKGLGDNSVDAVVTDPPYELGFMGKKWDASGIAYDVGLWREVLRVLKPGGHLLAFGGTRTYHRMAVAIEDAGFEIRDSIHWIYGSGFPKGLRPVPHMWQHAKSCLSKEAAPHVVQVSPCLRPALHAGKERTALALAVIQPEGVPALLTETGREDGSFEVTVTLLSESEMRQAATDWSMISSWKGSSDDAFDAVNMSIIETTSNTITVQKILSCLIGQNTPSSIRYSVTIPDGSQWPACDAGSLLSGERLKSQHIPVLTALAPATKNPLRDWQGWNVSLKPAHEPIVVARKPLDGTVAANVLAHGTGALNIDGCRVNRSSEDVLGWSISGSKESENSSMAGKNYTRSPKPDNLAGRWPSNVTFSHLPECGDTCAEGCAVAELDAQSGESKSVASGYNFESSKNDNPTRLTHNIKSGVHYGDTGGASRFFPAFRYQAKPSRAERDQGLGNNPKRVVGIGDSRPSGAFNERLGKGQTAPRANVHPTVKPVELMRWLVRLITPPGGLILDPFTGSGTTGVACMLEGFRFIGCEQQAEYLAIAKARIEHALRSETLKQPGLFDL